MLPFATIIIGKASMSIILIKGKFINPQNVVLHDRHIHNFLAVSTMSIKYKWPFSWQQYWICGTSVITTAAEIYHSIFIILSFGQLSLVLILIPKIFIIPFDKTIKKPFWALLLLTDAVRSLWPV